ncbi:MAG: prepilin-type N-terminal cleavage/methylation domain-containing protein [bacterium]|nr:prepilin-type N-terminal cleavage/methylation domain-containing protein [bacterium]
MIKKDNFGFTLIELLIVVAIIAILAAIAIPNFLAAQTRSKVSRVKKELQTVTTAIESYNVDNTVYPMTTGRAPRPPFQLYPNQAVGILPPELSTPIAYISSVSFKDPFARYGQTADEEIYTYHNIKGYIAASPGSAYWIAALDVYGDWRMCSIGPDAVYSTALTAATVQYDPTNGTISPGNIWRGQKSSEPRTGPIWGGY